MIVIKSFKSLLRLGAAPMNWGSMPKNTNEIKSQEPAPVQPQLQPVAPQPVQPAPLQETKPQAPPAQSVQPDGINELADKYVALTQSMSHNPERKEEIDQEREKISEQIMKSTMSYNNEKKPVIEFLNEAVRGIKKYRRISVEPYELLMRALVAHGNPRRNQALNFENRLIGVARYTGVEQPDELMRAKSRTKSIIDNKGFMNPPEWITNKYTNGNPEDMTHQAALMAVETYAWNIFEYGGAMLPEGIDKNNPTSIDANGNPVPFKIGISPESRTKRAFDNFNRTTDILMKSEGMPAGVPAVNYNDKKKSHGDTVTVRFACPNCGKENTSPEHGIGQYVRCKNSDCGQKILVPNKPPTGGYVNLYKKLGIYDALCKYKYKGWSLCNRSPWDIRKFVLDSAIDKNKKSNGALENSINESMPGQPITLDPARWEEGGDLWVHESMVNPVRRFINPTSLKMALEKIRRGRNVSLNMGGEDDEDGNHGEFEEDYRGGDRDKYRGRHRISHENEEASNDHKKIVSSSMSTTLAGPTIASAILGIIDGSDDTQKIIGNSMPINDMLTLINRQADALVEELGEDMAGQVRLAKFILIARLGGGA